jgi:acyl-CoA dehydrogenase
MTVNPSDALRAIAIEPCTLDAGCESLRLEVREFLARSSPTIRPFARQELDRGQPRAFSRKMGERGWIGMTWPKAYGGHERSALERYVVLEELLCAGAPVGAHWVAERQSGPLLMRFAPTSWRPRSCPRIARGETFFCIGMSEPTRAPTWRHPIRKPRAHKARDGWVINGRKLWTSFAHRAHYMIALVRTSERARTATGHVAVSDRHDDAPGLTVRPIVNQLGEHDFNEVTFDDVWVPHENLIGAEGDGWKQVGAELAFERSGPERYLSSSQLLPRCWTPATPTMPASRGASAASWPATALAPDVAGRGQHARARREPGPGRRLVKDQGALVEQAMPDIAHALFGGRLAPLQRSTRPCATPRWPCPRSPARRHARDPARHHRRGLDLR